jgi:hypothetical protein
MRPEFSQLLFETAGARFPLKVIPAHVFSISVCHNGLTLEKQAFLIDSIVFRFLSEEGPEVELNFDSTGC